MSDTVRVRALKSYASHLEDFHDGQEYDIHPERARQLITEGVVERIDAPLECAAVAAPETAMARSPRPRRK